MPKNVPTKKAPAKTEAAAHTATATTAPKEWTDLAIAAQVEVVGDIIVNPFTKEPIAKSVNGLLDVRRPGGSQYPKPENVKVDGSTATTFGKWCLEKWAIGAVELDTVRTRFDIADFELPQIEVDPEETPFGFVTGNYAGHEWGILVVKGAPVRVGKRTERGYVWCHPEALRKARGDKACPRSVSASSAEEAFKCMMGSFTGKFRLDAPAPATPKAAKPAPPAKATPTKTAPKKVPAKK
jgi:hypothetical protein